MTHIFVDNVYQHHPLSQSGEKKCRQKKNLKEKKGKIKKEENDLKTFVVVVFVVALLTL